MKLMRLKVIKPFHFAATPDPLAETYLPPRKLPRLFLATVFEIQD